MKRAAPRPACEPASKRAPPSYVVPHDVVNMIWDLMPQYWMISARRVCKRWKSAIDARLAPAFERQMREIKAEQAALALRRKDSGYVHVEWPEREYRVRAAFNLGYTHMLSSEFNTASKGRKSFRRLKFENVRAGAIVRLMSDRYRYAWADKDYAHALVISIVERKFDAVVSVVNMMRVRGLRVDLRAAKLAVEKNCGDGLAAFFSEYCTKHALEELTGYRRALLTK